MSTVSETLKNAKLRKLLRNLLPVVDVVLVFAATIFAYWLTTSQFAIPVPVLLWGCGASVLAVILFQVFGLYSMVMSLINIFDCLRLMAAVAIHAVCNLVFVIFWGSPKLEIGFSMMAIQTALIFFFSGGLRYSKRFVRAVKRMGLKNEDGKKRVMIVGGGDSGAMLINEMITSDMLRFKPVCIADDDEHILGKKIYDVKVAGNTFELERLVREYQVEEIFVAMPSVKQKDLSVILQRCRECNLPVKVLPALYQLANGQVAVSKLRNVEVQDLLGRSQVEVKLDEIMGYIKNKTVLVTGGGGSIGSELCRQIASHNPNVLIILDIYENNAYDIEQELKRKYPDLKLLTLIASIRDKNKIRDVFEKYRPQIVFNAAAHKHVPLMETSPNESVKNNVFGTLNVAKAADEFGVETFVQISTDKAVNPTNIMGATKRICEMIVQTIGKHSKNTKFVAVRFGNVLGSNGSVIPLFKRQIAEGGPVTVTHKDIIRYFMTIPEAVALVLQAGAYAKGGQIFVLDMGEPVKIYDLAYNLIKLSGLEPNVDIEIQCTGLRPGEKLYEERLMAEEGLQRTENGQISIAQPIPVDEESFWTILDKLYEEAYAETDSMKESVKMLVPTYTIDKAEDKTAKFLRDSVERSASGEQGNSQLRA